MGFSSYASSRDSSCSDLPNLLQQQQDLLGDHEPINHHHNNNDACGEKRHNYCESCDRDQAHFGETKPPGQKPGAVGPSGVETHQNHGPSNGGFVRADAGGNKPSLSLPLRLQSVAPSAGAEAGTVTSSQDKITPASHTTWYSNLGNGAAAPLRTRNSTTSVTRGSSTSSYLSPDLDIEFMDLDFEPGLSNSDSHQDFPLSSAHNITHAYDSPVTWPCPDANNRPLRHDSDDDDGIENDDNGENCFCDSLSDKFSQSCHFRSGASRAPGGGTGTVPSHLVSSCCKFYSGKEVNCSIPPRPGENTGEQRPALQSAGPRRQQGGKTGLCDCVGHGCSVCDGKCDCHEDEDALEGAVGYSVGADARGRHRSGNGVMAPCVPNNLDSCAHARCYGDDAWNVLPDDDAAPHVDTSPPQQNVVRYNVQHQTSTSRYDQDENRYVHVA